MEKSALSAVKSAMLAKLETSLLTLRHVKLLQLEPFPEGHTLSIFPKFAGFKIPYFTLDGKVDSEFYRFRFTQVKPSSGWRSIGQDPEKPRRYAQPSGTNCGVYLPPLLDVAWHKIATDPTVALVITEGELKAACACSLGIPTIGLGGVYNWRSTRLHQGFLPILEEFAWHERVVNLCFDSDIATNPMVRLAASRLAKTLADHGAVVAWTKIPSSPEGGKQGLDDYAFANGAEALNDLLGSATPLGPGIQLHEINCDVALVRQTGEIVELATGHVYSANMFTDVVYKHKHYSEWNAAGKEIEKFAAKEWLAWTFRNEVPRIEYAPEEQTLLTAVGAYNSWFPSQWAVQPSSIGTTAPWENLFQRMFQGLPAATATWVRRWFAYPIQHPGAKLYTALLVWGYQQGTGKTMLGETMSAIYGSNYGTVTNMQLASQFNEWAECKQFIVGDEISLGDKRHTANALKDMITRNTLRLNSKNRKTYSVRDCINYYFTSNHEDAVYLEGSDRRMFVHHIDIDPLAPYEYQAYQRWLHKEGGSARLFHYFLHEVDLGDFDPQGRAPLTSAKAEMMAAGRGDTEDWAYQLSANPDEALPPTQPYDLFRTIDLLKAYDPEGKERTRAGGLGRALSQAGIYKVAGGNNSVIIEGVRTRFWAVRHPERYKRMGITEARNAYLAEREANPVGRGIGASGKFSGAGKRVQ
jgi:hypothetical protein